MFFQLSRGYQACLGRSQQISDYIPSCLADLNGEVTELTVSRIRFPECPIERTIAVLSGRWKARIVWQLLDSPLRYSEINSCIDAITEKALTLALTELQSDGVLEKRESRLATTDLGQELRTSLKRTLLWGMDHAAAMPQR